MNMPWYKNFLRLEVDEAELTIHNDSPKETQIIIETNDLSSDGTDKFVACEGGDVDNVLKSSPIEDQNDLDFPIYNNNSEHGDDDEDIALPPVNMMMDVLEHMLTEVSDPTASSSSSSISEPALDKLDIVPESPKSITSSPYIMENSQEKSKPSHVDVSNQSNNDKRKNVDTCNTDEPIEKKKAHKLSLVCDRISKNIDHSSDLSTPSPIEEIPKLQLKVEQQETRPSDSCNITASTMATTTSLSTLSLLSSVMAKQATKAMTEKECAEDDSNNEPKATGEAKSSQDASATTATTVNACADFFNALLKSDKTLTSVSNQGN